MKLQGKVALVTGGSRGMGRAISIALARAGAKVAVNYYSGADKEFRDKPDEAAEQVHKDIAALGTEPLMLDADLGKDADAASLVPKVYDHFGRLDIVVCNAGVCPMIDFFDLTPEQFDRTHRVNLHGHFIVCLEASKRMIKQGEGGRFVAVSSIAARIGGPAQAHYSPTKSGLHSLMQCMAVSLGPYNITCNSVGPGEMNTDMSTCIEGFQEYWDYLVQRLPLRRVGQPEDIADPVVFLASDDSRYITGQLLIIDGGWMVTPHGPADCKVM